MSQDGEDSEDREDGEDNEDDEDGASPDKRPFHFQHLHPGTLSAAAAAANSIASNHSIAITCTSNWITFSKGCPQK